MSHPMTCRRASAGVANAPKSRHFDQAGHAASTSGRKRIANMNVHRGLGRAIELCITIRVNYRVTDIPTNKTHRSTPKFPLHLALSLPQTIDPTLFKYRHMKLRFENRFVLSRIICQPILGYARFIRYIDRPFRAILEKSNGIGL